MIAVTVQAIGMRRWGIEEAHPHGADLNDHAACVVS